MRPRILPLPEAEWDEATRSLIERSRQALGTPQLVFALLARHPRLFRRWIAFSGQMLLHGLLNRRATELVILRTAWNCQAPYEWGHHALLARTAGVTDREIAAIATEIDDGAWSPHEQALLRATDELHEDGRISDATWRTLSDELSPAQMIELCLLVGQYEMLAMLLNSVELAPEAGLPGLPSATREPTSPRPAEKA